MDNSKNSSFEFNNNTSQEIDSFMENNQFFSSSTEKNYILNSSSSELNNSFSSEKSCFIELSSSEFNISSSLEPNYINGKNSSPIKDSSSLEKDIIINPSSSQIINSPLNNTSNFKEDNPEKSNEISNSSTKKRHNKFAKDNIKRKIQVNYLKFLVNFINQIIKVVLCESINTDDIQFYRLNYRFAKDISSKSFNNIKEKTIGEIFKNNLSSKYKKNRKLNVQVYNKVTKKSSIIKKILNQKYLYFFGIYYSGQNIFNLSDYGLNININLSSKTGFCKDLITNNNDSDPLKRIYRKKILECIKKHFLTAKVPTFLTIKY